MGGEKTNQVRREAGDIWGVNTMRNRTNISVMRSTYRFGGIEHLLSTNEGDNSGGQGTWNTLNTSEVDGRTGDEGGKPGTSNVLNMSKVDGKMSTRVADWGD